MQIMIDISEEDYRDVILTGENTIHLGVLLDLREAVRSGTLLPKGHGNLYNYNDLSKLVGEDFRFFLSRLDLYLPQPIIKADKAESE